MKNGAVIILLFCFSVGYAQNNILFKNFAKENGLLSNTVYDIKIVKSGLLYIAHDKGLSSFDGTKFINYPNISNPFKSVNNILETPEGKIWCKGFDNVYYRLDNGKLSMRQRVKGGANPHYSAMIGHVIVGLSDEEIYFFDTKTEATKYQNIFEANNKRKKGRAIFTQIFISDTQNHIVTVDEDLTVTATEIVNSRIGVLHNYVGNQQLIAQENHQNLSLRIYPTNALLPSSPLLKNVFINNIVQLDSIYFLCTTAGVYRLNMKSMEMLAEPILENYNVSFAQKDHENNYWFSTLEDGLIMVPNFKVAAMASLPSGITSMAGIGEKILLGTKRGDVFSYNLNTNESKIVGRSSQQKAIDVAFENNQQTKIYSSNKTYIIQNGHVFRNSYIIKDYCAIGSNYLLGCNYYLFFYGSGIHQFPWLSKIASKEVTPNLFKIHTVEERVSNVIFDQAKQAIYYSNPNGVFYIDSLHPKPKKILEANYSINDLAIWQNELLVATKEKGLCVFENNQLINFELDKGKRIRSQANKIYIYENDLWIIADDGIHTLGIDGYKKYDANVGLPNSEIKNIYVSGDHLYANTGLEVLMLNKHQVSANSKLANLKLTAFWVNNKILAPTDLNRLTHKQNNIEVEFALIAYNSPSSSWAEYTINDTGPFRLEHPLRSLKFSSLSRGDYVLKIYPVTNGVANMASQQTIRFSIVPPFWRSNLFLLLWGILFLLIIYAIVMQILKRQKAASMLVQSKLMLEKELDKSLLVSIKAQMNPHFLFNALNTIQSYIYSNDKQNAGIYISKFSDLTRSILSMSSVDEVSLGEEINALELYLSLEKMRFESSFNYSIFVDETINKELCKIPSMLVQPYVENAIKHGLLHKKNNRVLKLNFIRKENVLEIQIEDNGIGRKRSGELNEIKQRKHASFSMVANKKRLDILKQSFAEIEFKVDDLMSAQNEPLGTKVTIRLPL